MAVNVRLATLSRRRGALLVPTLLLAGLTAATLPLALTGEGAAALVGDPETHAAAAPPPAAGTATVKAIVDPYLRIQEALSADSLDGIKDAARRIASEATTLGSSGGTIGSAAGEIQQADDLKAARAAFGTLGDAIMTYTRASNASVGDGVNVAYCPMVRKHWLQKGTRIQNPFYGKGMLECGRISASLPALTKQSSASYGNHSSR